MRTHFSLARVSVHSIAACAFTICVIAALDSAAAATSPEALRYAGCVTDSGGHAVAGAVVEAYHYPEQGRNPNPELVTTVTTGADGKFELTVPAYTHLVARKPGLAPAWRELLLSH